jgi:hypothetical protein
MRVKILWSLFRKEVRRHMANRGGLALAALLIVAAVLLSVFNPTQVQDGASGGDLVGGVHHCYLEYDEETPLITALIASIPPSLKANIVPRKLPVAQIRTTLGYSPGTGAIRVYRLTSTEETNWLFDVWHPPGEPLAMAVYEQWFFRAALTILRQQLESTSREPLPLQAPSTREDDLWAVEQAFTQLQAAAQKQALTDVPRVEISRRGLGAKPLDLRSAVAAAMVVFALYFTCCYLLPTMNCEERERGVLLAQALSPASPLEIVLAKFFFYPIAGMLLGGILAGIYSPTVLSTLFFWLVMLAMACGFLGIGMTISTLAKTQRSAFMGSMCYLFAVSLVLLICTQNRIPVLPWLFMESHGPVILHAALSLQVDGGHWIKLLVTFFLAGGWMLLAARLFRTRGWQ